MIYNDVAIPSDMLCKKNNQSRFAFFGIGKITRILLFEGS